MSELSSEEAINGWHQVASNLKLRNFGVKCASAETMQRLNDGIVSQGVTYSVPPPIAETMQRLNAGIVSQGVTYNVPPPIEVCHRGLHGCKRLIDTFQYGMSGIVCSVLSWGEIAYYDDKYASEFRKVIAIYDLRASYRRMIKQVFLRLEKTYFIKAQLDNIPELWKKVRRLIIRFINALFTAKWSAVSCEVRKKLVQISDETHFTVLRAFEDFVTKMIATLDLEMLLLTFTGEYLLRRDIKELQEFANDFLLHQIKRYGCKLIYNPSLQELGRV